MAPTLANLPNEIIEKIGEQIVDSKSLVNFRSTCHACFRFTRCSRAQMLEAIGEGLLGDEQCNIILMPWMMERAIKTIPLEMEQAGLFNLGRLVRSQTIRRERVPGRVGSRGHRYYTVEVDVENITSTREALILESMKLVLATGKAMYHETALIAAIQAGLSTIVEHLLENYSSRFVGTKGTIQSAIQHHRYGAFKALIRSNMFRGDYDFALNWLGCWGKSTEQLEMFKELLEILDPEARLDVFHNCLEGSHVSFLEAWIDKRSPLNHNLTSAQVNEALASAVQRNNLSLVKKVLLFPQADPSINEFGLLKLAYSRGYWEVLIQLLGDPRVNGFKAEVCAYFNQGIDTIKSICDRLKTVI